MKCSKCNGEGFLIIEDVENYFIRECPECEGEGEK
jgi:DnaJ-class molecular chaperone